MHSESPDKANTADEAKVMFIFEYAMVLKQNDTAEFEHLDDH